MLSSSSLFELLMSVWPLMRSTNWSRSIGDSVAGSQPPSASNRSSESWLKMSSRAISARLAASVVAAMPSVSGLMTLFCCTRIVVSATNFLGQNVPITSASRAMTAKMIASITRRRRASLIIVSASVATLNGTLAGSDGGAAAISSLPMASFPDPSEAARRDRDHVTRLQRVVGGQVARLQDLVQPHPIGLGAIAGLAVQHGVVGRGVDVHAAGGKDRVEHGHALVIRCRYRVLDRAGHADAGQVFVAAQLGDDHRHLRVAHVGLQLFLDFVRNLGGRLA